MNKLKINYALDLFALLSFVVVAISGLAIKFFMPSGIRQGRFQEFLGIQKGTWSEMHDISGIILIILVIIHLFLHADWIACATKNMLKLNAEKCERKIKEN